MKLIKRVSVGGYIKADTTGRGQWEVGTITDFDNNTVTFKSAMDGSEVKVARSEAFKATAKEYEEATSSKAAPEVKPKVGTKPAPKVVKVKEDTTPVDLDNLEDEDEPEFERRGVVPEEYRKSYIGCTSPNGNSSLMNGDKVSVTLTLLTLAQTYEYVAGVLGKSVAELKSRYQHLNPGMQRMNLGNNLRRHYREIGRDDLIGEKLNHDEVKKAEVGGRSATK